MKICLFGADFSTGNMGVSALASGCIKATLNAFPDAEIILYNYDKSSNSVTCNVNGKTVVLKTFCIRFSKNLFSKNHILRLLLAATIYRLIPIRQFKKVIKQNPYLYHLDSADMVASIAGGDSFSDIYGIYRFVFIVLPQILAIILKKNPVLLPQTHGPFKHRYARAVVKFIYHNSRYIYSRDHTGIEELKNLLVKTPATVEKIRFCYDVAFILDPIKPQSTDIDDFFSVKARYKNVIGLNISGLLYMGGLNRKNQFGLKIDYKKTMIDIAESFLGMKDTCLLLIPHVFAYNPESEGDPLPCKDVYEQLRQHPRENLYLLQKRYNQHEIKYIIGQCTFFVGARMHACIAAISQAIPAACVAYSKKFYGVMHSIGCEELVADPRKLGEEQFKNRIGEIYSNRITYRKIIQKGLPEIQSRILNLFSDASNHSYAIGENIVREKK